MEISAGKVRSSLESNCTSASGRRETSYITLHPSARIRSYKVLSTCSTWQWHMTKPGPCTPLFPAPEVWEKLSCKNKEPECTCAIWNELEDWTRGCESCKWPTVEGQRLSSCWDKWPRSLSLATIPGMKTSDPEHENDTQHILSPVTEEKRCRSQPAQCLPFRTERYASEDKNWVSRNPLSQQILPDTSQ